MTDVYTDLRGTVHRVSNESFNGEDHFVITTWAEDSNGNLTVTGLVRFPVTTKAALFAAIEDET